MTAGPPGMVEGDHTVVKESGGPCGHYLDEGDGF